MQERESIATRCIGGPNNPHISYRTETQRGHILGSVDSRTGTPTPERHLSPPAVCVMRALMHSALLWCSCHEEDSIASLFQLVKPSVHPPYLPEFFWMHLRRDLYQLSSLTGKGLEQSAIIVHLVLKNILTVQHPPCKYTCSLNLETEFTIRTSSGVLDILLRMNGRAHEQLKRELYLSSVCIHVPRRKPWFHKP